MSKWNIWNNVSLPVSVTPSFTTIVTWTYHAWVYYVQDDNDD